MSIKVIKDFKIVGFPAGMARVLNVDDAQRVQWAREYFMLVPRGRGKVVFYTINPLDSGGALFDQSEPFSKAALRRFLEHALESKPGSGLYSLRTGIDIRMLRKGNAYEVTMPCSERVCVRKTTLTRLVKELSNE